MMDELQSSFVRLLIPSPNQTYNIGDHRGSWIPNPQANTKLEYELFTFLGKLFGVAIRTQNNLNLSLPPIFWKKLMLEEVNVMDLKAFDETVF
mmetsp:Transcript_26795/g.4812  ORF Transcript_26795/g.4812 Transcript_26795/m.4812 type:complete len:93 (+) Transcript_26795:295-573(+)